MAGSCLQISGDFQNIQEHTYTEYGKREETPKECIIYSTQFSQLPAPCLGYRNPMGENADIDLHEWMHLSRDICDLKGNGEGGRQAEISPFPLDMQMTYLEPNGTWTKRKQESVVWPVWKLGMGEFYATAEFLKISHNYILLNLQLISSKVKKKKKRKIHISIFCIKGDFINISYCTNPTLHNSYLFTLITAVM